MLLLFLPLLAVADCLSGSNGEVVKLGLWAMLPLDCSSDRRTAAAGNFLPLLAAVVLVLGLAGDVASGSSFPLAVEAAAARSVTPPPSAAPLTVLSRRVSIKSPKPSPSPSAAVFILAKGELPLRGR